MHSSNLKWYIVILLLVLILGFLIFLSINTGFIKRNNASSASAQNSVSGDFSIFDTVTAVLAGKVTQVEDRKIFFENQKGIKGEASISEGVAISDLSKGIGTPSADLKRIELNKTANIILSLQDGKFSVLSITYPQP